MKRPNQIIFLAFWILTLAIVPPSASATPEKRCFSDENATITDCISEPFASFWQQNGGLTIFGYPLSGVNRVVRGTDEVEEQWFERARLELPLSGRASSGIRVAFLGDTLLQSLRRDVQANRQTRAQPGCRLYAATGHTLCEPFLSFYRNHGLHLDKDNTAFSEAESQALFGPPVTEPAVERTPDGTEYLTQWFRRARLELHPQNPPGARVVLGRLGAEALAQQIAASPAAASSCNALPMSQNAIIDNTCLNATNRYRTVFSLKDYEPQASLSVWLTDVEGITIGTRGRETCGLQGNSVSLNTITSCRTWQINQYGHASGVELDGSALYPGRWMLVLQSQSSDHNTTIFFEVLPRPPAQPDLCAGAPASVDTIITPSCGQRGGLFKIVGHGFVPGEDIVSYVTAPDTIVEPFTTPYYQATTADTGGKVTMVAAFPDTALKGDFIITIVGTKSGHKAIGALRKF